MSDIAKLQQAWEDADAKAIKLSNEYDEARQKARDRYADRLRAANQRAAEAQKALLDAQVAESLKDRPDGEAVARALGISLAE